MEQEILQKLQKLYNVTHIPVSLLDGQGNVLTNFPKVQYSAVNLFATAVVLDDFRAGISYSFKSYTEHRNGFNCSYRLRRA